MRRKDDVARMVKEYTEEIAVIMAVMSKDREMYMLKRKYNLNRINKLRDKIYTLRNG